MTIRTLVILAAGFALSGCATVNEFGSTGKQNVTDAQGNVAGFKQLLRNERTGEVAAQVRMFAPIHNDVGDLIGYEEQTQDGALIRDLDGRQVGARFHDLRSRSTNARNKGVTVIIGSLYSRPVLAGAATPAAPHLVALLSARDLRAVH